MLEFVEARLDVYKKNEVVFEEDIKILKLDIMLRDNPLTELRKKFEKAKKERDNLKLILKKIESSSKNLSKLLEIQVSDKFKTGVGFDSQVFDSQENDKYKTSEGYHAIPPPYTRNFMPSKPNLVLADEEEYVFSKSITSVPAVATSKVKTSESKPKSVSEPLIEDWISNSEDENETEFKESIEKVENNKGNPPKFRGKRSQLTVDASRHNYLETRQSTARIAEKRVIDSGCSRYMTRNKSYLSDYKEIDGGFVSFGGDPKGGRNTGKGKISIDLKVKVIRCDNGTEFKNKVMNQFCEMKGIKREFSVARTPQQNRVAERKNRTLIEAARTMLADSKLPTTFWAKAVNTACYVQNRVLVIKPHNKTPYELFLGRKPALSFMRPFGCPVTILNTLDHLVVAGNQTNGNAGTKENIDAGQARKKTVSSQEYILLPLLTFDQSLSKGSKDSPDDGFKPSGEEEKKDSKDPWNEDSKVPSTKEPRINQEKDANVNSTNNINTASDGNSTNNVNTVSSTVNATSLEDNAAYENTVYGCDDDPIMPNLEEIAYSIDDEDVGTEADMNNLNTFIPVSPIPTIRLHKDHPLEQIIGDIHSLPQTRRMTKSVTEHGMFSSRQQRINHKDFQNCLFACFLSQVEPKKVIQALTDPSWIETMQDELLQFKLQKVWTLVDLPYGKRAIGTKWVYKNKKDDRGIVVRNKARLVAQGYTQEEGIDYDEVFALMDVKSAFLYGTIEEEVKQKDNGIFISQDKYVANILKKFDFATVKTASTPMETNKASLKDEEAADVDVHLYRSMIGSLMYLTASRPDIMFALCACARQEFHNKRLLISWKKVDYMAIVANSITKAEYVAPANYYGQ
ncbi:ribonuclease H-like domain-containing protein, partial [Tanacetum coccineum]